MTHALAQPALSTPSLRLLQGGAKPRPATWYEKRSMFREIVGGCPDHWWNPPPDARPPAPAIDSEPPVT